MPKKKEKKEKNPPTKDQENSLEEIDQEKLLDDCLLAVKGSAYQMRTFINQNKLKAVLKCGKNVCDILNESNLTPLNYYTLYISIFDEMQYLYNYFKEEARRGRRMKDLYDTVQQCETIVARLYLLITVASAYIETGQPSATDIIFDLLNLIKGVQNPLKGLFCRYFFLKMIKDKLPDKGNEFEKPGASSDDTIKFILINLDEMNRLWIRLSYAVDNSEINKEKREKERDQLKILVGENINRLSSLNAISAEIYQKNVLPKIIEIVLDSNDILSQQYLMECIIKSFPDEYNISQMNYILENCEKLQTGVDVKNLFINLMDKLTRYVENIKDNKENLESTQKIFNLLQTNINKILKENISSNIDVAKLIELQNAFIKFSIKCCPENERLQVINHILGDSVLILAKNRFDITLEISKAIGKLLEAPLLSNLSIFEMPNFPELMKYLDYGSRATLSLRIIDSLVSGRSNILLDTSEKMSILIDFIRPLLEDSPDASEFDASQFEYEQNTVCKIIFIIKTNDPQTNYDILNVLKNVFIKGGIKRIKYTLPSLVNAYINLAYSISAAMNKVNNIEDNSLNKDKQIHLDFVNYYNLKNIDSNDLYHKFMRRIYNQINDVISIIENDFAEIAFKLYLTFSQQINSIQIDRVNYEEHCYSALTSAIQIVNSNKVQADNKLNLINIFVGTLLNFTILGNDNLNSIITNIVNSSQSLLKRSDQCVAILSCVNLYANEYNLNKEKVKDCLIKAKRFADFAMTNPQNAILFLYIINKYLYLIEKFDKDNFLEFIQIENINDIIELVKNHIHSLKVENKEAEILPIIEEYYNNTITMIGNKKKEGKKIYTELIS